MAIKADIINIQGEVTGQLDLAEKIFDVKVSMPVVHEVVTALLANRRRGTHSTKTKGEVSGGGHKPWKQKHTGRARSGSIRSPLWRHGGVTFGPKPRDYNQSVPAAKKRLALRMVLSDGWREGRFQFLDSFEVSEPKTKIVAGIAKTLKIPRNATVVVDQMPENLKRAARNFAGMVFCRADDLNTYQVLKAAKVLMTVPALNILEKRLVN